MAEKRLKGLVAQRNALIEKMQRIKNFLIDLKPDQIVEAVNIRLTEARDTASQVKTMELNILGIKPDEPLMSETEEWETIYYEIEAKLGLWLRNNSEPRTNMNDTINTTQHNQGQELRLPKAVVPTFYGNYTEWQTFHDLFCSNIHDRPNLTPSEKFQFLCGYVKGEASTLIKHLKISDANYYEALEKLRDRYNRKKQIVNSYISTFLEQQPLNSPDVTGIRRLLDTSDEILRGLRALGNAAESRDPWIIRLLLNKLDTDTREKWAEASKNDEFPTVNQLFKFLQGRIDALEDIKSLQRQVKPKVRKFPAIRAHVSATINCPCCRKENHKLAECSAFKQLSISDRRKLIQDQQRCFNCLNINHPVFRCMMRSRCGICGRKHHSLLHPEHQAEPNQHQPNLFSVESNNKGQAAVTNTSQSNQPTTVSGHVNSGAQTVLPTAIVKFETTDSEIQGSCRILLDSGSQVSFVSEAFIQRFKIPLSKTQLAVAGIGQIDVGKPRGAVKLNLLNEVKEPVLTLQAFCLPKITSRIPLFKFNLDDHKYIANIRLADPSFNVPGEIDLLLGADHFFNILEDGRIKTDRNNLLAQNTKFGWVVAGNLFMDSCTHHATSLAAVTDIEKYMKCMWETEAVPDRLHLTEEEQFCESLYKDTTKKNSEGRFVVRLPFKEAPSSILRNSVNQAISRFYAIERRFKADPKFGELYRQFMEEYLSLGHMRELSSQEIQQQGYYIPHHGVLKWANGRSKIRVVFDASAKDSSGRSLNEIMRNGPSVQSTLYSILIRFRMNQFVFTTDIQKMYRQILVAEDDRRWQRIVWRSSNNKQLKHFELVTVTYGTKSAPLLATRTIKEIAKENLIQKPVAAKEIAQNIYVDDLMTGSDSVSELMQLKRDVQTIFSSYKMCLGKWVSNCKQLLTDIPEAQREIATSIEITEKTVNMVKVLGLLWDPKNDNFSFTVSLPNKSKHTKRTMLSEASRVFDPLGLISPCIIPIKILLQQLWKVKLEWDDELPMTINAQWILLRTNLIYMQELVIPRWMNVMNRQVEVHGFCDASEHAYGAVIYIRAITNGEIQVSLLTSKSKVAPVKSLTIPKLELCAAVLLTKLLIVVKDSLNNIEIRSITSWTDSTIVLDWLSAYPKGKDIFVKNRTASILDSFSRNCWNHVPSSDNPADLVSRGTTPQLLKQSQLWWKGPTWLSKCSTSWPEQPLSKPLNEEVYSLIHATSIDDSWLNELTQRMSSFERIVKVIARIKQLYVNSRLPRANRSYTIKPKDINHAEYVVYRYIQHQYFREEISRLRQEKYVATQSCLRSLHPFIDSHGVLRVGGRLSNAIIDYNVQHPIILSNKSIIVKKLVEEAHNKFRHAGPTLLNSILKQRFHIVGGRVLIRSVFQRCVQCKKAKPITQQQLMADLPKHRVQFTRPFLKIGVDYAGPFMAYLKRGRGQRPTKIYMCIFVCLTTKAVHIEVANDMTTNEFLAALKRMTARRGLCSDVFSDCGSNFIGANKLMIEWYKMLKQNNDLISQFLLRDKITWHFNPPSAPHFGGLWEAAVKSFKTHLKRVVGQNILTICEFNTLVIEIEGILNSRPLCRGDDDVDALTPAHFLIGHPITSIPEAGLNQTDESYLKRWQLVKEMVQHFWLRWHKEYLTTLQHRYKWQEQSPNIEIDDIVMVKDQNMATTRWPLGRVIQIHQGSDGLVRIVSIKTQTGIIQRPIHKLMKLPISESTDSRGPGC